MKSYLVDILYNFSKLVYFTSLLLIIVHILLTIAVLFDYNVPKFVALDIVEYPNKLLIDSKINYKIVQKNNPSKQFEVEYAAVVLSINTNHDKSFLFMILLKRIIYLIFFATISYALGNIFGYFSKEMPFVMKSVKQLKIMAFAFILLSPIMLLYDIILQLSLTNYEMIGGGKMRGTSLNLQYVFYGLVILAISQVFQHGSMLQKEFDQTI